MKNIAGALELIASELGLDCRSSSRKLPEQSLRIAGAFEVGALELGKDCGPPSRKLLERL